MLPIATTERRAATIHGVGFPAGVVAMTGDPALATEPPGAAAPQPWQNFASAARGVPQLAQARGPSGMPQLAQKFPVAAVPQPGQVVGVVWVTSGLRLQIAQYSGPCWRRPVRLATLGRPLHGLR